jgi:hyperosmotically inducible protein
MSTKIRNVMLALSVSLALGAASPALAGEQGTPPQPVNSERSAGTALDDASITASVKSQLLADDRTEGLDINVDTHKGRVTLRGGADSQEDKDAATAIASAVSGVVSVENLIVVAPEGSDARIAANEATASGKLRASADQASETVDDGWITAKIKTQLLADSSIKGTLIEVSTEDNVVSLTGVLPSNEMRAKAILLAEQTKGVRDVRADDLIVR